MVRINLKATLLFTAVVVSILFFSFKKTNIPNSQNWILELRNNDNLSFTEEMNPFFSEENNIYVYEAENRLVSINKEDGEINWVYQTKDESLLPGTISENNLYLIDLSGNIYCLDKETGETIWISKTNNQSQPDTKILTDKNNIYLADRNGSLYAFDKETGENKWTKKYQSIEPSKRTENALIHFGDIKQDPYRLFISNDREKTFQVIRKSDQTIKWSTSYDFENLYPLLIGDEYISFYDKKNNKVTIFDKFSGKNLATIKVANKFNKEMIIELDNKIIYANNLNYITELDPITKETITIKNPFLNNPLGNIIQIISGSDKENKTNNQSYYVIINKNLDQESIVEIKNKKVKNIFNLKSDISYISNKPINNKIYFGTELGDVNSIDISSSTLTKESSTFGKVIFIIPKKDNIISLHQSGENSFTINNKNKASNEQWQKIIKEKIKFFDKTSNSMFLMDYNRKKLISIVDSTEIKNISTENIQPKEDTTFHWQVPANLIRTNQNNDLGEITELKIKINNNSIDSSDINIKATFNLKDSKDFIKVKGFYLENDVWLVRVILPQTGEWEFNVSIIQNRYLLPKKLAGVVTVNKSKDQSQVSFIKMINNKFYLNNQPFFGIGIQDSIYDKNYNTNPIDQWNIGIEKTPLDINNEDKIRDKLFSLDEYLNFYNPTEGGINIMRVGINNYSFKTWKIFNEDKLLLGENEGIWLDELLKKLKEKNIRVMLTIFGFEVPFEQNFSKTNKKQTEKMNFYLDYMIGRYGPYVDIWELANETKPTKEWTTYVTEYLEKNDPYHHPITISWERDDIENIKINSVHWYQNSPNQDVDLSTQKIIDIYSDNAALILSEVGNLYTNWDKDSALRIRAKAWISAINQVPIVFWNTSYGIYENLRNANVYLGPIERRQLAFIQKIMSTIKCNDDNCPESIVSPDIQVSNNPKIRSYSIESKQSKTAVIYLFSAEETITQAKISFPSRMKQCKIDWYNPKTGNFIKSDKIINSEELISPSFSIDLVGQIFCLGLE